MKGDKMRILVIDDEMPARMMLADTIREISPDYEVVTFGDVEEYDHYPLSKRFDVAFIDIELGGEVNGIQFAFRVKKKAPFCNIIFVTSYSEYAREAFSTRPSGYVLKPVNREDIEAELEDLRHPLYDIRREQKLKVVTFGNFVVYKNDEELLTFSRNLGREIFAYLIDNCGYSVTTEDIARDILEEEFDKAVSKRLSKVITSMIDDLEHAGYKDIIVRQNRKIAVNKSRISCDLYDALLGDVRAMNCFRGEYMIDYSWAELSETYGMLRRRDGGA